MLGRRQNLPTALRLANVRPLDVQAASVRVRVGAAQLQQAQVLWLPTFYSGTDYYRHDGQNQLVLWELKSMGFGNRALVREKEAENRLAILDVLRLEQQVAADIMQARVQAETAAARIRDARDELRHAQRSLAENLTGLKNTRQVGDLPMLIARPQEVVAAVQALGQAYADFYSAVADYNRAQFRLYRAVGNPANVLAEQAATAAGGGRPSVAPRAPDRSASQGESVPAPPLQRSSRRAAW